MEKYGMLSLINGAGLSSDADFICECGNNFTIKKAKVISGAITDCGCKNKKLYGYRNIKHGMRHTRIYKIWKDMRKRCKPNTVNSKRYSDRGINVCERWGTFEPFYNDMIETYKDNLSLDRIDNNKGYSPENCRWTDAKQQARNRTTSLYIEFNNKTMTFAEFCETTNISYPLAHKRYKSQCWSIKEIYDYYTTGKGSRRKTNV